MNIRYSDEEKTQIIAQPPDYIILPILQLLLYALSLFLPHKFPITLVPYHRRKKITVVFLDYAFTVENQVILLPSVLQKYLASN